MKILENTNTPEFTWTFGVIPFVAFCYLTFGWALIERINADFAPILLFILIGFSIVGMMLILEKSKKISICLGIVGWCGTISMFAFHMVKQW